MPVVPRLDPTPVGTAPLPAPRVATDVPTGAFGVTGAADLGGLEQHVANIIERQRAKADTVALLDADNRLATLQTDLNTQARELRGRDAMGAGDVVAKGWDKGVADITKTLRTDTQRQAFANRVGARWGALYESTETHAAAERDQYVKTTAQDALALRLAHATEFYQQPGQVQTSINETKAILEDFGKHDGWAPETLAAKSALAVSSIHAAVIDRMVANRQDLAAAAYVNDHREELTADQLIHAEQLVTTSSIQGASQRTADDIVKASTNITDALASAGQILNPSVREEVEQRVRRTFEDRAYAQRQQQLQQEISAAAIIRKTGSLSNVPAKLLNDMTSTQIRDLKMLEESLRRRPSDPDVVGKLRNQSGLDPAGFAQLNLPDYRDQLSDADLRALQTTQRTIRQAATRTAATTRTRQTKDLRKAETTEGFYKSQGLVVPDMLSKQLKGLRDSLGVKPTTPRAPGAPLPAAPRTGSGAPPAGALPTIKLPGTPDEGASLASVPDAWREAARANPDYAAYLATMGVSIE